MLKGVDVDTMEACVFSLFYLKKYFSLQEREYGDRVVSSLRTIIDDEDACFQLSGSSMVLIQVVNERSIRVIGVSDANDSRTNGEALVQDVFQKIDFWVNQEGYAKFTKCRCCFEKRNQDQGVTCENNHFYCSIDGCLDGAIRAQLTNLASRKCLLCPECPATYDIQTIASHITPAVWDDVQKTLIDREVKLQHEVLAREFDERLEMKVQELIQNYGAADLELKFKAQKAALVIRNTILNLACPHCHTAYFEFTGCMALQCESCKGDFCGYCHQGFTTASGTHEHVRNCVLNETANSSYYANEAEVKMAQRRYRTRKLRKHSWV